MAASPLGASLLGLDQDVLGEVLQKVGAAALCQLKAASVAWRTHARRELFNRLCCREGQPEPAGVASITDLDVQVLNGAGRPWEVVVAGRQLPQLARLHGFGLVVDVQAVRQADVGAEEEDDGDDDDDDDDDADAPLGGAALRRCIQGEGEPPHELLLAAVACAASGKVRGVPVKRLRDDDGSLHLGVSAAVACAASGLVRGVPVQRLREDDAIDVLDLEESGLGVISAELLSLMLPAATSVRSLRCVPQTRPSRHQPAFPRCTVAPTFLSAPIDMPTLSPSPPHPLLAVSETTASDTRAPPRSPPSSRRRRSPT
jgi:hypothetical protein